MITLFSASALTTNMLLVYDKKFAAVKNDCATTASSEKKVKETPPSSGVFYFLPIDKHIYNC